LLLDYVLMLILLIEESIIVVNFILSSADLTIPIIRINIAFLMNIV
jgi:hypothetical protein